MAEKDTTQQPSSDIQPSIFAPSDMGSQEFKDWCISWCRWGAGQWNPALSPIQQPIEGERENAMVPMGWAENVMLNTIYWNGKQSGNSYGWMFRDMLNKKLPAVMRPGQQIYVRLRHIQGNITKQYERLPDTIYVKGLSNEILNSITSEINVGKWKIDLEEAFRNFEQYGTMITSFGQSDIQSAEQLAKLEETAQEAMEEIFTWSARDFLYNNHYEELIKKISDYALPAWYCRVKLEVDENRDIVVKVCRPYQCIWDNTTDSELGRDDTYSGEFDIYTPGQEIADAKASGEPYTEDEEREINAMASFDGICNSTLNTANLNAGFPNKFEWWSSWNTMSRTRLITRLTFRWKALDKDNIYRWYKATFVGNKYLRDFGLHENQLRSEKNPKNVRVQVIDMRPDIQNGIIIPLVERLRLLQERRDMLRTKMDQWINQALGRVLIVYGDESPQGKKTYQLISELKQSGATTIKRSSIDDGAIINKGALIDTADLGFNYNDIVTLQNQIQLLDAEMEEISSVTKYSLGTQQQEIGAKVQEQTLGQATYGLLPFYKTFTLFINEMCQMAVEMYKLIYTEEEEKRRLRISPRQYRLVKYLKEYSTADLSLWVKQSDVLEEEDKKFLKDFLFNLSQNSQVTGVTMTDAAKALTFTTKTELINFYEAKEIQLRRMNMAKEAAAAAQEKERLQMQNDAMREQEQMRQQGNDNRAELASETKLADTMIKESNAQAVA